MTEYARKILVRDSSKILVFNFRSKVSIHVYYMIVIALMRLMKIKIRN
jgi:hypothetical protein